MVTHRFTATCPAGVGVYLAQELTEFGASEVVERPIGVQFSGDLGLAYRICLWSRLANRVILELGSYPVQTGDELYEAACEIDWLAHVLEGRSLMVDFAGRSSDVRNPQFGALRIKDAIVDQHRAKGLARPTVDVKSPDIRIHARLSKGTISLGIDLSGESLHRRGYRLDGGLAPLKENIAAAALWASDWPTKSREGEALIDPMCGSSTLLLEGALMALDIAPGLNRRSFGFDGWAGHDLAQWRAIKADAEERRVAASGRAIEIRGYDGDIQAVRRSQENIQRLGLENTVRLRCKDLAAVTRPTHRDLPRGLLIVNPPWGERMGSPDSLPPLYNRLGQLMSEAFEGWRGVVLTSELDLGKAIGLRASKKHRFHNGRLELHCLQFDLSVDNEFRSLAQHALRQPSERVNDEPPTLTEGAEMVMNRLRKNYRRLKPWIERESISNYRLYDADIPEYAAAIDIYEGHLHIAEYAAPKSIPDETARRRLDDLVLGAQHYAGLPSADSIAIKRRQRQRGAGQYQKLGATADRLVVHEGRIKALVNLHDYLDTGLFLDHRPLRSWIASEAKGRHFLNLFSYTGVATLHAAAGGATTSTSVDASATYLDWFKANLALNGFSERQHRGVRSDVRTWLATDTRHYDLIMLDPPSFSNSKGERDFDVQADHETLLELAMARLSSEGVLYFSTNRRRFELSESVTARWCVENVTVSSIPEDFSRHQRIHACWRLQHPTGAEKA